MSQSAAVTGNQANVPYAPQPADMQASDIEIQILGDLAEAASEWKNFEAQAECTPFQTFGWLEKWQRHIGTRAGTLPAIVFGRDQAGEILFILPLAIEARDTLRRLMWLGSELGDYNAPLLCQNFDRHPAADGFAAVWDSVVKMLHADPRFRFDLVDLQKMPEMVGAHKNPFLRLTVLPNRSGAYVATLGRSWDEYYAARRSSSTRKTARRKQRQLEEHGTLRFLGVLDPVESARTLETLIEQKSRYFARLGVENIFERPGYRDFYLDLVTDAQVRALGSISRLDVGETIAATSFGLQFRDSYYLNLSSYYDGELSRFGPGRVHLHELLRDAIERGFQSFDFTIGDEPYKLDWSDIKLTLYDHIAASSIRSWPTVLATVMSRRLQRYIKQTPVLWRAVTKIRALAGRVNARPADIASDERS
jgi:CelD/BcsL family acetyltransferase involved in cellulose biosynthesis